MDSIPYELIFQIAYNLSTDDIQNLCLTNQRLSRLCQDWRFWYNLSAKTINNFNMTYDIFTDTYALPRERHLRVRRMFMHPNEYFAQAVKDNDLQSVKLLLPHTDQNFINEQFLLNKCIRLGHVDIFKLLLSDSRVDIYYIGDELVYNAARYNPSIIMALLEDGRLNLFEMYYANAMFDAAILSNHIGLLKKLLEYPNIDLNAYYPLILVGAKFASLEAFDLLLADPRIDVTIGNNDALMLAVSHGRLDIFNRLWSIPEVNVQADLDRALVVAIRYNQSTMVERLLEIENINPSSHDNMAIKLAYNQRYFNIVNMLARDPRLTVDEHVHRIIKSVASFYKG